MRLLRVLALGMASLLVTGVHGADAKALPAAHAKAKLTCHDCHKKEKPTTAPVSDEACMVCHGDYPAMKAMTKEVQPNPHGAPHDPIACTACHRQHKPPVVTCLDCHAGKYTFKVK